MTTIRNMLTAVPLHAIGRRPDVVLAILVAAIVAMLIVPMPAPLLDALLALDIAASVVILLVALFAQRALDVSSFPTLLLVTTLFRLALNVSTTRGILAHGDAGHVVKAFGRFVLEGDVVVGFVVFLVVTLVQFLVIAKGSERVAEVAARFTLDAMPGKQMAIDAALRSGAFDEAEAQRRRSELARESQLFGNMDGAMKFVKGDAIAALVITALNLVAGLVIGVVRGGMNVKTAIDVYSILSVGDGLVSQIPALLITLAAGVLVTRVEAADKTSNLGATIKSELGSNTKALKIAALLMFALGLVPGLPLLPFFVLGAAAFAAGSIRPRREPKPEVEKTLERAKKQRSVADNLVPTVVPIGLDLDAELSSALGFGGAADGTELLSIYIPQLRDALYMETGVRIPGIRVRTDAPELSPWTFAIRVNDVPVLEASLSADQHLAIAAPEALRKLGIVARPVPHPMHGATVAIVSTLEARAVEAAGVKTWNASGIIALHLAAILKRRAKSFLGFQEVGELVERLEKGFPTLVKEVVPKVVSLAQLLEVLRRLVDEGVSIRDLKSILQALGEHGAKEGDILFLTEKARAALASQIAYAHAGVGGRLPVVLLHPAIEDTIAQAIAPERGGGRMLLLPPEIAQQVFRAIGEVLEPILRQGHKPVILTNVEIRRYARKLLETEVPDVAVLSYDELPPDLVVQPLGRATFDAAEAA